MSELRLNTAGQFATYRFIYASTGNTVKTGITASSVTIQVIKVGTGLTTIVATTTNFISVIDGIYKYINTVTDVNTIGEVMFGFSEAACLPFEMLHSVITVKDWDYRYSTAGSSIDDVKVDTASCVVAIASVRANMGYASTEAAIKVDTASTVVAVASLLVNVAAVKVDTASTVVAIASVRANMGYASTETAIKVETASMLAKIDILDTVADTIKVDTASTVVAIASVLANYAQASTVAGVAQASATTAIKVETASILTHVDNIGSVQTAIDAINAGHAQASTVSGVAKASAVASIVANVWGAYASTYNAAGTMGNLLNTAGAGGISASTQSQIDNIQINAASAVTGIASILTYVDNIGSVQTAVDAVQIGMAYASQLATVATITTGVWNAYASTYNAAATMGNLLNTAGAGGISASTQAQIDNIQVNATSVVVGITSVLANYAQASSVAAIKVDTASTVVAIASVRANMGYASTEAAIKVDTASTLAYVTSAQVNIASVIVAVASVRANMGYASTEAAIKVETASMLAKIDIIDTVADTIKVDTASTVVAIASVLTNYAQASAVAAVKVDTASTVVAIASVLANYAQASTVIGVAQASAIAAVVNAQVLDVLNVDTFAEPSQGAPAATTTIVQKLGYIFKFARNKLTATSTTVSIYADDAITVDQKSTVSDDGTTFTRGEIGTGP